MSFPTKEIQSTLTLGWASRMDGRREECVNHFQNLRSLLPILQEPVDRIHLERIAAVSPEEYVWDAVILQSSIHRMERRPDLSKALLNLVEDILNVKALPHPFWLLFEFGMHLYHFGDLSRGLEYFGLAAQKARTPFERLCALSNTICCLHHMGLPFSKTLSEVEILLTELKSYPYIKSTEGQQKVIHIYSCLRRGDFAAIMAFEQSKELHPQIQFIHNWVTQLPYHPWYDGGHIAAKAHWQPPVGSFQSGYRLRTLQNLLHPDDTCDLRLSDWADRLYLWVWRWLVQPQDNLLQKVMTTLAPLSQRNDLYRLNVEDRSLVRNALLWLSLFDPSNQRAINELLTLVDSSQDTQCEFFEFEKLIIYYWLAIRDRQGHVAQDYVLEIKRHRLYASSQNFFAALVETDATQFPPVLKTLRSNLMALAHDQESSQASIQIDMASFEIADTQKNTSLVSEPICRVIEVLNAAGSIEFRDVLSVGFGISNFDSSIHTPKIYNLVSRLKKIFEGKLVIKTKSERVYVSGNWSTIEIKRDSTKTRQLAFHAKWRNLLYNSHDAPRTEPFLMKCPSDQRPLSRLEIEAMCGKSRATTVRLLKDWERRGLVKREGQARATSYYLSEYLRQELQKGRKMI